MRVLSSISRRVFTTALLLALLAGCAQRDAAEEAAWQASRHGTAAQDRFGAGLETGSRIVEKFYYVAKYQATMEQRESARTAARKAVRKLVKNARPNPSANQPRRVIAVKVRSDSRAKTRTSVMLWDTQAQDIVGNNVYDVNETPPIGTTVQFDTYAAEYVGGGE